ncbi:uncharacterized protein BO80DRAFT_428237 [Aspergillus ibericus CBS 121593]|uniref:Uncharacterized protein n=1 Tax=Aspergillus ibericus CBS 121593 TaxID=1448316 RepID=A0A395GPE3_9EURO|nr:hypothetical protein BO80DRAFT_428237 [Aspergillus ibericus CBS 121593]RAK97381.1 hypothetical protein BO80DRAFT_428237 [Aspergillus ibericus CBS 121593]
MKGSPWDRSRIFAGVAATCMGSVSDSQPQPASRAHYPSTPITSGAPCQCRLEDRDPERRDAGDKGWRPNRARCDNGDHACGGGLFCFG